jgi:uncharacterized protein DUF6916
MKLDEFTYENMTPFVGSIFHLTAPDGETYELKLIQVLRTVDQHVDQRFKRDSFSLLFQGPPQPYLQQATYPLTHDALGGPHHIFIVPTSRQGEGFLYEAVFT